MEFCPSLQDEAAYHGKHGIFFSENGELSTVSTCLRPLLIKAATTTDRGYDHYWSESGAVVIEGIEEYCPARPPIIVRMRLSARASSSAI